MKKTIIIFLIICLIKPAHAFSSPENTQLSQCGINALYFCLKSLKIETSLDEMYSRIQPDVQNNVSLKQLIDYAKSKGVYAETIPSPSVQDIQNALHRKSAIILQYHMKLSDGSDLKHMVALIEPDTEIFLLDYPKPMRQMTSNDLVEITKNSEGMSVLSTEVLVGHGTAANSGPLRPVSFYLILSGVLAAILTVAVDRYGKHKKPGKP